MAFRINAELTQDGSELRNLAGRTMRIADGLSRSHSLGGAAAEAKSEELLRLLEQRTCDMQRLQALLKDASTDEFMELEPEMVGDVRFEEYGMVAQAVEPIVVLFLAPYAGEATVQLVRDKVKALLAKILPGPVDLRDVEPAFEDECTGEGFWFAPFARQPAEAKRRFRKQALAGVVTVLRAVSYHKPRFIVGVQQGGVISLLCGRPAVVETATRQRVATTTELNGLRKTWPNVLGFLVIEPFVTAAHSSIDKLKEALPEFSQLQGRDRALHLVPGTTSQAKQFGWLLSEVAGAVVVSPS